MFDSLVSIIVPIYNRYATIRVCIDSILSQEYKNIEIILVDDGSDDGSSVICDEYEAQDDRVIVFHQENLGVSNARNRGLLMAKGNWVTFVDSDDAILPNHISQLVKSKGLFELVMVNRTSGVIKNGNFLVQNDCCGGLSSCQLFGRNNIINYLFTTHNPYKHAYYAIWDKFFRKQTLDDYHITFNENMSFGEDQLFVLDYLSHINSFMFSNVGTYMPTPLGNHVVTSEHLGYKLRLPDEYMNCFLINYRKLSELAKETELKAVKKYAINYIAERSLRNIVYRYLQPRNIRKIGLKKLYFFIKEQIFPIYSSDVQELDAIIDTKIRSDVSKIKQNHLFSVIVKILFCETYYWLKFGIKRKLKKFL